MFSFDTILRVHLFTILVLTACFTHAEQPVSDENQNAQEDPFASPPFTESGSEFAEADRFEGFNRAMFGFNEGLDKYILKPVAKTYRFVTPAPVDQGITNFFNNLDDVETFANSLLQGKFHNAIVTLNRIIWNTSVGLLGFFDVATSFGLQNEEEDFGQTLAVWGYEDSSYIVLPFLGPSTVRDFAGTAVDGLYFDALDYVDEINDDERLMLMGLKIVDLRADLIPAENLMAGGDKYLFLRNAYLQNRNFLIKDGEVEDNFSDDDFEVPEGF